MGRYFKNAKYVKDAASETERAKFVALNRHFQQYGDKYDVDWLLAAAQGYQESQLDQAAKRGLDPNVWFHNVEYVAAEKIGAETVTYVSNICKYYIACRLMMEAREDRESVAEQMKGANKPAR